MPELPDLKFEIIYGGQTYPVTFSPIGWDKLDISGEIDDFFLTIWEKLNSELKFVIDGAEKIRQIMLTNGANADAFVRILKKQSNGWDYKQRVFQQIDFQKYSDINGVVTVGFLEKSIAANIRTFLDVQYAIPLGEEAVNMNIGGIGVDQFAQWAGGTFEQSTHDGNLYSPTLDIIESTTEEEFATLNTVSFPFEGNIGSDAPPHFVTMNKGFPVRLTGHIKANIVFRITGVRGLVVNFIMNDQFGNRVILRSPYLMSNTQNADFDYDITFPAQLGSKIRLYMTLRDVPTNEGVAYMRWQSASVKIQYQQYTEDYTAKGLRAFDLFKALLGKINPNSNMDIQSPVLTSGLGNRVVVASGDCIRGIPGAVIQTSFREFIETFNAQLFSGLKLVGNDVIQKIRYDKIDNIQFNNYSNCGSLGVVKDAKYESITQDYAGGYKVGYVDNSYDKADGRDEFNTEVDRSVIDSKATNTVEIISTYRADPRGVDQLLIDYRANPTRDNTGDKQNFQFVIREEVDEEDGLYHLVSTEIFAKVEGTSALGRIYNLDLAPIFMFMRNTARVAVQFALKKTGLVRFESSKKNGSLKMTRFDGSIVSEKDTVSYDQMNPPLYLPIKCTFTAILSDEVYDNIIADVNARGGFISYIDRGQEFKGFPVSYSHNLTGDNVKEFTVYLHRENDLTTLFNLSR